MNVIQITRRDFLKSSFFAGSGLVLGFSGFPVRYKAIKLSSIPPYLRIDQDGGIYLGVPSAEMGQGIHTTLAMLVAEELENEDEIRCVTCGLATPTTDNFHKLTGREIILMLSDKALSLIHI